jgi:hypothetical protein
MWSDCIWHQKLCMGGHGQSLRWCIEQDLRATRQIELPVGRASDGTILKEDIILLAF